MLSQTIELDIHVPWCRAPGLLQYCSIKTCKSASKSHCHTAVFWNLPQLMAHWSVTSRAALLQQLEDLEIKTT